ncbi:MAG: hypothetical protein PHN47_06405 [Clostridia bacterium]|nr:hypothetical protein [Clostridia bacterium]
MMYYQKNKNIIAIATEPIGFVFMCSFTPTTENKNYLAKLNHKLRMF